MDKSAQSKKLFHFTDNSVDVSWVSYLLLFILLEFLFDDIKNYHPVLVLFE